MPAGVGSDLDRPWPLELLPFSCDALVLTQEEHDTLMASGSRFARELGRDARWVWCLRAAEHSPFSGPLPSLVQDRCG